MGVSVYAYLGPYIAVRTPYKDSIKLMIACPNPSCSRHLNDTSDRFCPACGTATASIELPYKKKVNLWEELNYEDKLIPIEIKEQDFLIANVGVDGILRPLTLNPNCGTYIQPISGAYMIEEEIVLFKKQFQGEIKKLTDALGEGKMEICWGFFSWMS